MPHSIRGRRDHRLDRVRGNTRCRPGTHLRAYLRNHHTTTGTGTLTVRAGSVGARGCPYPGTGPGTDLTAGLFGDRFRWP